VRAAWIGILVAVLCAGCGPSVSSVKELNESNAKILLREYAQKKPLRMPVGLLTNLFSRTTKDYSAPRSAEEQTLKRLLDQQLVLQSVEPGAQADVKWYTYSWNPAFQKQIQGTGISSTVVGGEVEIGEVSNLRLVDVTEATATFAWKLSLNNTGKTFLGDVHPSGNAEAEFGKKPDGTWFVDRATIPGILSTDTH
jgi:hypothetical protein